MEDKIYDIITDLLRDDISKSEAIGKLLVLCDVSQQRELLWAFVSTMEFDVKHETYKEDIEYFLKENSSL